MRSNITTTLVALLTAVAAPTSGQKPMNMKPVLVSYNEKTPQSVVDEAMDSIRKAVSMTRWTPSFSRC